MTAIDTFSIRDVIAQKRDGGVVSASDLRELVERFTDGRVADYQMAAFAMAVVLRGMAPEETAALTLAMRDSGRRAHLGRVHRPKLDKHSTGGVGDKVSICLAPLVAVCGAAVPMISGRALGHTGGTLDKLEAIPGFRVDVPLKRFERLVARHGFALIGQTADLAPADRKLYALRDVTSTVASVPLITASILSKKLSADLDGLVMDVKVGRGAFMKTLEEARTLARSIVRVGRQAGLPVSALLTRMDHPLGRAVGNALETAEAFELLQGRGPDDLRECTLALGSEMLRLGKLCSGERDARRKLEAAITERTALRAMERIVRAQGGDPRVVSEPDRLPRARHIQPLRARRAGWVCDMDALDVARICMDLGAARSRADQTIDPTVGVVLRKKPGEPVARGEVIAEVHAAQPAAARLASARLGAAFVIGPRRRVVPPLVIETIRR